MSQNSFSIKQVLIGAAILISLLQISVLSDARYELPSQPESLFSITGGFFGQAPHYHFSLSPLTAVLEFTHKITGINTQASLLIIVLIASTLWISLRYTIPKVTAALWVSFGLLFLQVVIEPGKLSLVILLVTALSLILYTYLREGGTTALFLWVLYASWAILELHLFALLPLLVPLVLKGEKVKVIHPAFVYIPIALACIAAASTPSNSFRSLEAGDRVVQERSRFLTGTDPILGKSSGFQVVDRQTLRRAYAPAALVVFCVLVLGFSFARYTPEDKPLIVVGLILSFASLLDSALVPEGVSVLGPLYATERLIPNQLLDPLLPKTTAFAFALWLLSSSQVIAGGYKQARQPIKNALSLSLSLMLLTLVFLFYKAKTVPERASGKSLEKIDTILRTIDQEQRFGGRERFLSSAAVQLLGKLDPERLHLQPRLGSGAFRPCRNLPCIVREVSDETHRPLLEKIIQGPGRLRKGERLSIRPEEDFSFTIEFPAPIQLKALVLNSHPFITDFPRSFSYQFSNDCALWEEARSHAPWSGALLLSADDYPVLRQEHWIELHPKLGASARCFRFKKQSYEGHFDWSLTSVVVRTE